MSNYTTLGEDQPFEWNVVPLNVYLYGVENAHYRPLVGSQQIKHVLEERYRENYLGNYCASESCQLSREVAERLRKEPSFEQVYVLKGGWKAWKAGTRG